MVTTTSQPEVGAARVSPTAVLHTVDGPVADPTRDQLLAALAAPGDVWLDLTDPDEPGLRTLGDDLGLHPLIVEDAIAFGRRLGIASVGECTQAILRALTGPDDELVEVHVLHCHGAVVTVRHGPCDPIDEVASWTRLDAELGRGARYVLFRVLLALADSYLPALESISDRLDDLEDEVFADVAPDQLVELTTLRRTLAGYRRGIVPLRNRLAGGASIMLRELSDPDRDVERYARDLYDQLVHVAEAIDAQRDHIESVMDVYLSMVSNSQNQVMKQLTVVATVFLPLSFVVGFFGMNFAFMVRNINSAPAFWVLGIGVQVATVVLRVWLFKRRQWV